MVVGLLLGCHWAAVEFSLGDHLIFIGQPREVECEDDGLGTMVPNISLETCRKAECKME